MKKCNFTYESGIDSSENALEYLISRMQKTSKNKGFTLVEIMVVVTLIGLLAVSAIPVFQRIKLRAVTATFVSDMRLLEEAFQRYAQEFGNFPADTAAGIVPPGMAGYIDADRWANTTVLGGNYKWYDAGSYTGIMVIAPTISLPELSLIDEWVDDGNVAAGNLLVTGAGSVVLHVLEERI